MRILFCNFEYPPLGGGGGVFNQLLAEELAAKHEVAVLTTGGSDLSEEEELNGVKIIRTPSFIKREKMESNLASMFAYLAMGVIKGKKLLGKLEFDLINTHFALPSGPVGYRLSRLLHIPNVLTVHGGDLYDPSKFTSPHRHFLLRLWIRRLLGKAHAVVGQSNDTIANLHAFYHPHITARRIPLGIKRPPKEIGTRQNYHFEKEDILLVTVGRLVLRKSIHQLIAMMGKLRDTGAQLIIIGEGALKDELKREAKELKVDHRVHFMGFVPEEEKFRLLRMSDIFVSASAHEGFGLVFLEAMASGLPVICYDKGGQTDFLKDGETGFVVKLNHHEDLADKCRRLIRETDLRKKMGEECLRLVEDYFIDASAAKYEALFSEISRK